MARPRDLLLGAAFLAGICAPAGRMLLARAFPALDAEVDRTAEMRQATPVPTLEWTRAGLEGYPRRFDSWFSDGFAFRNRLLEDLNAFKWFVLDTSPTDLMVKGKDGWIFTTADSAVDVVRGAARFTELELETWRMALETRRDWLAQLGIRYHLVLGPNKHSIYPEYLPDRVRVRPPSRLDQLYAWLEERSDFVVPDLRPDLLAAKVRDTPENPLYYKLGTHWTERGSFAAYQGVCRHLLTDFPHIRPLTLEDMEIEPMPEGADDSWAGRMYLTDWLHQEGHALVQKSRRPFRLRKSRLPDRTRVVTFTHQDEGLPRLVMYHDSFATEVRRYLANHFSEIVTYWRYAFDQEMLAQERPDAVLQLVAERSLVFVPPTFILSERQVDLERAFDASGELLLAGALVEDGRTALEASGEGEVRVDGRQVQLVERGEFLVRLPGFETPPDRWPLLRIEFGPHDEGELNLLRESRDGRERTYLGTFPIEPGQRALYLHLMALEPGDRVLLGPRGFEQLSLVRLQVRAVERGRSLSR